ncbi:MAG: hypothetical protein EOO77_41970 [Oxalobacteraceae bacterium]|nr:MAG: hypothetical protein EOO77_41970 [Oxalobacteraceae bacterium]
MTYESKDLPRPPFLWTLDQCAQIVNLEQAVFTRRYVHFQDLTAGPVKKDFLLARNIAPLGDSPEWRISESELLRWLKSKGFRPRYNPMF